ncbi:uncharacterized protein LOC144129404 [Amblyomma americanum]
MAAAHKQKGAGTAEDPELHIEDAEVGVVNEGATGLCAVSEGDVWPASAGVNCGQHSHGGRHRDTGGSANSYSGPTPESGRSNAGEDGCKCSPCSTLPSLYDGHHRETGRPEAGCQQMVLLLALQAVSLPHWSRPCPFSALKSCESCDFFRKLSAAFDDQEGALSIGPIWWSYRALASGVSLGSIALP